MSSYNLQYKAVELHNYSNFIDELAVGSAGADASAGASMCGRVGTTGLALLTFQHFIAALRYLYVA